MTFTQEEIEAIEHLKDPKQAQALGLLQAYRIKDYDLLKKIGIGQCDIFCWNGWTGCTESHIWNYNDTYTIKDNFIPKPEPTQKIVKLEIKKYKDEDGDVWLGCYSCDKIKLPHFFTHLHCLPSIPGFIRFSFINSYGKSQTLGIDYTSASFNQGITIFAEFEKESI